MSIAGQRVKETHVRKNTQPKRHAIKVIQVLMQLKQLKIIRTHQVTEMWINDFCFDQVWARGKKTHQRGSESPVER